MKNAIRHIPASFEQIVSKVAGAPVPGIRRIVSLFSGCGGMDLGFVGGFRFAGSYFDKLPCEIIWANDAEASACETYRSNMKHGIHCGDVTKAITKLPKQADIVIGGFPCQDFSISGKRRGFDSKRGLLYQQLVRAIKKTAPTAFVAENVTGLLSIPGALDTIKSDFEKLGYRVFHRVLKAQDHGVPQRRERLFFVGLAPGTPFSFPKPTGQIPMTAAEAISDLEDVEEGGIDAHYWSKAKKNERPRERASH